LNKPLTKLDIIKHSRVTEIIWRQELNSTQDDDKLKMLIDAYIECVPLHYVGMGTTFKDFIDDVKSVYFNKIKILEEN
jgi:hypothetical protein